MTVVLSIDPGSSNAKVSHTGIVLLDGTMLIDSWAVAGGLAGFRGWCSNNADFMLQNQSAVYSNTEKEFYDLDVVVCEQFVDRQVRGADRSPLLVEGAVRFLWPDVVLQPASGYKQGMPDSIMEELGFNSKSFGGDHHADRWAALRHGLLYLKRQLDPGVLEAFRG